MAKIMTDSTIVSSAVYGWKGHWVSWLSCHEYRTPYTVFLPATGLEDVDSSLRDGSELSVLRGLLAPIAHGDRYDVAVRSSAICEDTRFESHAGSFKTVLGQMSFEEILESVKDVIRSLRTVSSGTPCKMGVIIQRRVDASFSGVAFSSNPLNGNKSECVVAVIHGMGSPLVSGEKSGEDIVLRAVEGRVEIPSYAINLPSHYLEDIFRFSKEIEGKLGYPVDIEWCIEHETGMLFLLQCRPSTGILHRGKHVILVSSRNQDKLPVFIRENDKVKLRLIGERTGVLVSRAYLITVNCTRDQPRIPSLASLHPTPECQGYSVVLIHPKTLAGKVRRAFLGHGIDAKEFLKTCQRYFIRAYPQYSTLRETVQDIVRASCHEYWVTALIVQEIFDPKFGGIIKRLSDGYMIEMAQGHFLPKGVVRTTQYVLSFNGTVIFSNEVYQDRRFRIIDGYVIEEELDRHGSLVSVPKDTLQRISREFAEFLDEHTAVEFGIIENQRGLQPYLIDFVKDRSEDLLDATAISEGIVSHGKATGKLLVVDSSGKTGDSLDAHFHDVVESRSGTREPIIFLCSRPDISLLRLLERYSADKLGFIFKEGSVLCHLAIILRERGIPAVIVSDLPDIEPGTFVTVDAVKLGIKGRERVHVNAN